MDNLSITLTNPRVIDGIRHAARNRGVTAEAWAEEVLTREGSRHADKQGYGVLTSAGFFARFTPQEYASFSAAAANTVEVTDPGPNPTEEEMAAYSAALQQNELAAAVADLLQQLTSESLVRFDDPRIGPGLELLVSVGVLTAERAAEIAVYERPSFD